jgi:hypothetical protein
MLAAIDICNLVSAWVHFIIGFEELVSKRQIPSVICEWKREGKALGLGTSFSRLRFMVALTSGFILNYEPQAETVRYRTGCNEARGFPNATLETPSCTYGYASVATQIRPMMAT